MAEYIEREALEKWLLSEIASLDGEENRQYVVERLRKEIPTADVQPVRHGRWVMNDQSAPVCSRCGNVVAFVSHPDKKWDFGNYCPNCGARMGEWTEAKISGGKEAER